MGASSIFAGGLVGLTGGGAGLLAAAAIAGAIGDDVCARLMAGANDQITRIDDPASLPANHHFLRVLRRARLQAIGQMAEEARRDLHLDENGSPFLRAVTDYVALSLKDDPDAALDPRALIAREVGRAPSANTAVNTARGMIDVHRAVAGWFQRPAEAPEPEAWLTESDRIALIGLEFLRLVPTRLAAAIESGTPFAQQTADERIAVFAGVRRAHSRSWSRRSGRARLTGRALRPPRF